MTTVLLFAFAGWMLLALSSWAAGRHAWWLDVANNGPQYTALAAMLAVTLAVAAQLWRTAAVFSLLGVTFLMRWYTTIGFAEVTATPTGVVLLVANVQTDNADSGALLDLIMREQPEIIGLLEVDLRWLDDLSEVRAGWPYFMEVPRADNFGLALYSRTAPLSMDEAGIGGGPVPSLKVVTSGGMTVWLTHPLPPVGSSYARDRDSQLAGIGELLQTENTIVMGDLNVTPWSAHFPQAGAPVAGGTWPSQMPWPLRIPIDHVLVGPELELSELKVGSPIGGDHRPVLARVRVLE